MKLLLSIYFFILGIIQAGLFSGVYHYYRTQNIVRPSSYWMASLLSSIAALLIFGAGILTIQDMKNPEFNFTLANFLFFSSAALQALFCQSLLHQISRRTQIALAVSLLVFLCVFEYMRHYANFEIRTIFMASLSSILYASQIYWLRQKKKQDSSKQLTYLQYASSAEMFFALGRIAILTSTTPILEVDQLPQILILFTIAQLVMNTLSYIAIGGYWAEQIAIVNAKATLENEEIKRLLQEREQLIGSLLKANKSASTGALSASIAHELNQPLGASSLNIQFLQKKLAEGHLSPVIEKEILETLLSDNQRAASIIRSLRSIFSDEKITPSTIDMAELVQAVLNIAKPEMASKNIQLILRLEPNLTVGVTASEIQQALLNLVNNAIQALAKSHQLDKKLTIEGAHVGDGIQITIADNGDGISADAQAHLFELLSSSKNSGMGLGLWLCKHIVTRHGGLIWSEASADGGAKFVFQLPSKPHLS
jgi:signal transduction histidine kinase